MKTLILNIKQLVQTELSPRKWVAGKDMARLGILENAYLLVEEDKIAGFGKMEDLDREAVYAGGDIVKEIDATGRLVMPSYCDSHTHLVYAGSREIEYIDKIRGLSYEEIAKRVFSIHAKGYVKLLKKSFSMQPMTGFRKSPVSVQVQSK